jgi:3-hydroxyacyl-[acyl-carrier protein] dehydratase/trans-2-decenoyl-[acyl-carrier protein] isomerase
MKYTEFMERNHFELEDLLAFSYGNLVEDPPEGFDAHLPAPPFLMMDRIISFKRDGRKGAIVAAQDLRVDAWYFQCHFPGDPVQPGCLCVDAIWQLLGFYCVWRGSLGAGRALGCKEVSFNGQIRPYNKCVRYEIDIKRYFQQKETGASVVVGDGNVFVDDELIAVVKQARSGIFSGIAYPDYPKRSENSVGGVVRE